MNRWAAGFLNSMGPLAGQRNEWNKLFTDGLIETENELLSLIGNKNRFASVLDPANRLPYIYSPVTGKKTNDYSFLQRVWNAYSPLKVHAQQSEEEAFLQAIEYDMTTTFRTKDGVRLLTNERSELFRLMGESDQFRRSIREVMRNAGDWKSIARLKALRREGRTSEEVPLDKWEHLHVRLRKAQKAAEKAAYAKMDSDMYAAIEMRRVEQQLRDQAAEQGKVFDPTTFEMYRK